MAQTLVAGGEAVNAGLPVKGFLVLGGRGHARCVLQMAAGVGRRLRGVRAIAEDWPDWISVAGVPSPGPAWGLREAAGEQSGDSHTVKMRQKIKE